MKNKATLIIGGVVVFIILLAIIGGSGSNNSSTSGLQDSWYYIQSEYKCVKAANEYRNEDSCAQDVGTYCHIGDPTCGKFTKLTLYYIDSTNHCALAPHNPYSPIAKVADGNFAQQDACQKDVGHPCYADDNTCGGAGLSGMVTINGAAYKLSSVAELKNIHSNSDAIIAVQGKIVRIIANKNTRDNTPYDFIVQLKDGTIPIEVVVPKNEQSSFDINKFSIGTNIVAGGVVFVNDGKVFNYSNLVNLLSDYAKTRADTDLNPAIGQLNLPLDTPIVTVESKDIEIVQ